MVTRINNEILSDQVDHVGNPSLIQQDSLRDQEFFFTPGNINSDQARIKSAKEHQRYKRSTE